MQWMGITENLISKFNISGGFGNPNILSTFLSSIILFGLHTFLAGKKPNSPRWIETFWLILVGIFLITSVLLIIVIKSRSAWISLSAGSFYFIYYKYHLKNYFNRFLNNGLKKIIVGFLILGLLSFFANKLFEFKSGSAYGRLLIWKNTAAIIYDHPFSGVGFGAFNSTYLKYQAKYFEQSDDRNKYFYLADDNEIAYNEFLQIWAETGFMGLVIFILFIVALFKIDISKNEIILPTIASLIVLLFNSIFSYTIQILPIFILFVIYSAILTAYCEEFRMKLRILNVHKLILMGVLAICIHSFVKIFERYQDERSLKVASDLAIKKNYSPALSKLEHSNNQLITSKYFILLYGRLLILNKQPEKSIEFLEKNSDLFSNHYHYMLLGESYSLIGNHEKAILNYQQASNIIPHLNMLDFLAAMIGLY